ncbi:lactadherin-like isoform X1 [Acropora muricata]|uniref:lactadherin-like isoform X1 n=2 Tax=Acropora muricata TaxID=159855 RepID=UPI0034E5A92D
MWTFWRSLWVVFLSVSVQSGLGLNPSNKCNSALGLEDLSIQDSQLTAQSYYESLSIGGGKSVDTEPKCARLNKNNCAWCAPRGNGQYLQVDLRSDFRITGIATQGFEALMDYYVRRYKVSHSRNGLKWRTFPVMTGNRDGRSVVRHTFTPPVYARYIRVYPVAYRYRICMRMELYGCSNSSSALSTTPSSTTLSGANNATSEILLPTTSRTATSSTEKRIASSALSTTSSSTIPSSTTLSGANNEKPKTVPSTTRTTAAPSTEKPLISHSSSECNSALGLEDLKIQDSQLTAQSYYESLSIGGGKSVDTEPKCARLNKNKCAWCAPRGNGQQYLQVDLRHDFIITGIATQGLEALSNYYVKRYKVSHSRDGYTWSIFPKVMRGNRDGRSVVRHTFSSPVYARYIRVYPKTYRYRICMRMELYGCSNSSSALSTTPSSTTLSGANNTLPESLLPMTRTTAASSTEKPIDQPVGSGGVLITTPKEKETQQSGRHALQTGNSATEMVKDSSRKRSSKTLMIALVVVALALVIIICLLAAWLHLRGRKRSYRYSSPKMEVQLL